MPEATYREERRRTQAGAPVAVSSAAERLYRASGDVAPGLLWLVDGQGQFVYVNKTWENFTGSTLERLNQDGWEPYNHPDDLPEVRDRWERAGERREPFEMELRYRRKDGEYRWMLARVVPL